MKKVILITGLSVNILVALPSMVRFCNWLEDTYYKLGAINAVVLFMLWLFLSVGSGWFAFSKE